MTKANDNVGSAMSEEGALSKRRPISGAAPTLRSCVHSEQVRHFVLLARELVEAAARRGDAAFVSLPEYRRFSSGAYACGFVCSDGGVNSRSFQPYIDDPGRVAGLGFLDIRRLVHFMMRAERWSDMGGDEGGGAILDAVRSGCLAAVADRLENATEWRGD